MAYHVLRRRSASDVSFDLVMEDTSDPVVEDSSDPVVTIKVSLPMGFLLIMGEPAETGRTLVVKGVHISSSELAPNSVGVANLRVIAEAVMEKLDYDEIRVEGEIRTTGANKGHRPRPLRFARSRGAEPAR